MKTEPRRTLLGPVAFLYATDVFAFVITAYLFAVILAATTGRSAVLSASLLLAPSLCIPFVLGGAVAGLYRRQTCRSGRAIAGSIALAIVSAAVIAAIGTEFVAPSGEGAVWPVFRGISLATLLSVCVWAATVIINRWALTKEFATFDLSVRFLVTHHNEADALRDRYDLKRPGHVVVTATAGTDDSAAAIDPSSLARSNVSLIVVSNEAWQCIDHVALVGLRMAGIEPISEVEFNERRRRRVDPTKLSQYGLVFSAGLRNGAVSRWAHRCLDVASSLGLLLLTLPLLALTALAVRLDSPGPVLYRQTRVGFLGRRFEIIKFRSMRHDAESDGRAVWAQTADSRVTRVGRIIRKFRIDELPQLFNVLAGDMSLIGPRPERPEFVESLSCTIPFYDSRHCTKPGITGWAQVNYPYGASFEDARMKLEYDLYYIKHRSLALYFRILLSTVRVVLRGEGAR